MKRAKYLYEWFPPIIEEKLTRVIVKDVLDDFEKDMLKNQIGLSMFGDLFDTTGTGNEELTSRANGFFGAEVRKWTGKLTEREITVDDL